MEYKMKLSDLLDAYIDVKMQGEPEHMPYESLDNFQIRQESYFRQLTRLSSEIDGIIESLQDREE